MSPLRIEVFDDSREGWVEVAEINFGDRDGTLSDNTPDGRDVYQFGVDPVENQGYVKRSERGYDVASPEVRAMSSEGFVTVAALSPGHSHEQTFSTDSGSAPRRVKFTYLDQAG